MSEGELGHPSCQSFRIFFVPPPLYLLLAVLALLSRRLHLLRFLAESAESASSITGYLAGLPVRPASGTFSAAACFASCFARYRGLFCVFVYKSSPPSYYR